MNREKYFICIGTTKSILDGVAPRVGSILKNMGYNVLGTSKDPLNAKTLLNNYELIKNIESKYRVIAVDASTGSKNNPSVLTHVCKPCFPGKGVGNDLGTIGHETIHINVFKGLVFDLEHLLIRPEENSGLSQNLLKHTDKLVRLCIKYITNRDI